MTEQLRHSFTQSFIMSLVLCVLFLIKNTKNKKINRQGRQEILFIWQFRNLVINLVIIYTYFHS